MPNRFIDQNRLNPNRLVAMIFVAIFSLSNLAGEAKSSPISELKQFLSNHKGKVIYVDFWASWCKPCRESFPWMNKMKAQFEPKGLKIITINLDKEPELAEAFLAETPAEFKIIYDQAGETASQFNLKGMPMSYVIGRDGKVKYTHSGFNSKKRDEYQAEIEYLLNQE